MTRTRSMMALFVLLAACGGDGGAKKDFHGEPSENAGSMAGCIEKVSEVSADESTPEGQRAKAVLERMAGTHTASLSWQDGDTELTVEISQTRLLRVESREDPNFTLDIGRHCVDRLRVDAVVSLKSADGRLDETLSGVAFDVPDADDVTESGIDVLSAWTSRKANELQGAYVRQTPNDGQLTAVYFSFDIDDSAFSGSISEEASHGDAVSLSAAIATWSKPWQEAPSMPELTADACKALGGFPVLHDHTRTLCGERKTLGYVSADFVEPVYCCELTAKFCWGPGVTLSGECGESTERYYRVGGLCVPQGRCTCEGTGCSASFDSVASCELHYEGCDTITYKRCGGWSGSTCTADEYCAYLPPLLCGATDASAVCLPRPTDCDTDYAPVCGCDGKTYSNLCVANAAGQGISAFEACP